MPRTRDDIRAAEAARMYAEGHTAREVATALSVHERTVRRWIGDDGLRRTGPRGRTDITDEQVWRLRYGAEKLSQVGIAARTGLSRGAVRKRLARMTRDHCEASP